jgi:tRNA dimethylallyltransferase
MPSPSHSPRPLPARSLLLAGPTAVGKSAVALCLAERLKGEIISVDSMQVYRGLDIGTAKPLAEERARVPHHLIDVCELTESFSAARFIELAHAALEQIVQAGRLPIFCGGTGLYFKALLDGLGEGPPADPALRAELEATPAAELLLELEKADPHTYARIDRKNPRRLIRAIEVIRLTGKPFSSMRADWKTGSTVAAAQPIVIGLTRSAEDVRCRIDQRVDEMFKCGLVQETERLLDAGLANNPTAMQALGYRQVVEYLQGQRSLEETIELVKIRTRQFAKRQMTWLRRQLRLEWLEINANSSPAELADLLAKRFNP